MLCVCVFTDAEPRLVRVQSPGPEATLPDDFGVEWKKERDEQVNKDEETRAERKKVCQLSLCGSLPSMFVWCK